MDSGFNPPFSIYFAGDVLSGSSAVDVAPLRLNMAPCHYCGAKHGLEGLQAFVVDQTDDQRSPRYKSQCKCEECEQSARAAWGESKININAWCDPQRKPEAQRAAIHAAEREALLEAVDHWNRQQAMLARAELLEEEATARGTKGRL